MIIRKYHTQAIREIRAQKIANLISPLSYGSFNSNEPYFDHSEKKVIMNRNVNIAEICFSLANLRESGF